MQESSPVLVVNLKVMYAKDYAADMNAMGKVTGLACRTTESKPKFY
jgi:hypothetical protein